MSSCHFIGINVGSPSPPSSIGFHVAVGVDMLWWLPTDAILVLNFTSDLHVNELSVPRICVF